MGKKLYVGSLPPDVTDVQLNAMFAACGTVTSAEVMMEKRTGQSRGFGFVEMSTHEEAQEAIKYVLQFWNGERESAPVKEAEKWKCNSCKFFGGQCKVWWTPGQEAPS